MKNDIVVGQKLGGTIEGIHQDVVHGNEIEGGTSI